MPTTPQAMSTPSSYLGLFTDLLDENALAEATALQQAAYAKQLSMLERCLAGLRSKLCVGLMKGGSAFIRRVFVQRRVELDSCVQKLGRHVQECRQLFAGLSSAAQKVARPPVPSPAQLIENLHSVWCG